MGKRYPFFSNLLYNANIDDQPISSTIVLNLQHISGSAFRFTQDKHLHHGTILYDVNIERMQKYLNVNKEKLLVHIFVYLFDSLC